MLYSCTHIAAVVSKGELRTVIVHGCKVSQLAVIAVCACYEWWWVTVCVKSVDDNDDRITTMTSSAANDTRPVAATVVVMDARRILPNDGVGHL